MVVYLLVHCSKARLMWDLLLAIFGIHWLFPLSIRETLLSWRGSFVGKKRKNTWIAAPFSIFWTIWRERNYIASERKIFQLKG